MLKKTITYTDYNGMERTEDFYFNLSKAELMEMEMSTTGGMEAYVEKIVNAQDAPAIVQTFRNHQKRQMHLPKRKHTQNYSWSWRQTQILLLNFVMELCLRL